MNNLPFDPGVTGISFLNDTGETIPAHAVMAAQGVGWNEGAQTFYLKVAKPTEDLIGAGAIWCFNGPVEVANNKTGKAFFALHQPAWCKVVSTMTFADADVAPPELEVGPVAGEWHASEDGTGLIVMGVREDQAVAGEIESDRLLVLQRNSGSGTIRCHFQIESFDEVTGIAVCIVKYRPCGMSAVPGEVAGRIEVRDPACCYFDEPAEDLVGRWGHADYMQADDSNYPEDPYEECVGRTISDYDPPCWWIVSGLCCPPA